MKLEIMGNSFGYKFCRWLVTQIQLEFKSRLNQNKLRVWDSILMSNEEYTLISIDKPVKAVDVLEFALKNLQIQELFDKSVIKINSNQFMPGFDRVKVITLCNAITFGTTSVRGYPILKDVLQYFADNIGEYVEMYMISQNIPVKEEIRGSKIL